MNEFPLPQKSSTEQPLFLPQIADGEDKSSPFKNRIRKNYRHIRKWAKRTHTDCFRIYDRDIKEYPVAIDFYGGHFLVQYFSYDHETDEIPADLVQDVEGAITSIFQADLDTIYSRTRIRRKKTEQYEKIAEEKEFFCVHEYGVKFKVNLHDYLDTGLFLDHRETRQLIAKNASQKRLLNLFAYTSSLSIHRLSLAPKKWMGCLTSSKTIYPFCKKPSNCFQRREQFFSAQIRENSVWMNLFFPRALLKRSQKKQSL